jgi:uncharacterized protein (TIGR02246 family)
MDANDEHDIRAVMAATTDLWIRHEIDSWGAYFTEDADFVTHRGVWWISRQENVAGHKNVPAGVIDQKKNYTQDVVTIQEITPDVALVHTRWEWPDHLQPGAEVAQDRGGIITYVLVKRQGRWLIRAAHNTGLNS